MSGEGEFSVDGFKALAHPLRYRILATIADTERNVGEIEQASGITQPALSQQLAILRKAGMVTTRREAKQVYYALSADRLSAVQEAVSSLLPEESGGSNTTAQSKKTGAAVFARMNI